MNRLSIRLRLTLWYVVVLLLGLALFGWGTWLALDQRLMKGVDERLAQKVQGLKTVLEIEGAAAKDRSQIQDELSEFTREIGDGQLIQIRESSGGFLLPASGDPFFPGSLMSGETAYRTISPNREQPGRAFRIFTSRIDYAGQTYAVLVATPLEDVQAVLQNLRNLLLTMAPLVLIAACLGGYWISRRALAPVDEITRVAKSISVENLSKRLVVPQTDDELQRMSETWNQVLERLETAVMRIRQFTADASHELRTPVALIRSTAELALRRERDREEYRKALREIEHEAERMTELTASLLTLARADSDKAEFALTPLDLNIIVREVIHQSEPLAGAKGVHLNAQLAESPAAAAVNEAAMRRLLLILIDNALKYTPPGGSVDVSTRERDHQVTLSVKDTGEGIPADALPHIFERFYRADEARGRNGGAGLGLSIARMIAQAHGSEIEVESAPGAGSCFRLSLSSLKLQTSGAQFPQEVR